MFHPVSGVDKAPADTVAQGSHGSLGGGEGGKRTNTEMFCGFIPFFSQKAVFCIPVVTSGSNFSGSDYRIAGWPRRGLCTLLHSIETACSSDHGFCAYWPAVVQTIGF